MRLGVENRQKHRSIETRMDRIIVADGQLWQVLGPFRAYLLGIDNRTFLVRFVIARPGNHPGLPQRSGRKMLFIVNILHAEAALRRAFLITNLLNALIDRAIEVAETDRLFGLHSGDTQSLQNSGKAKNSTGDRPARHCARP